MTDLQKDFEAVWNGIDRREAQERARRGERSFREPLERLLYAIEEGDEEEVNEARRIARDLLYPESGGLPPWRSLSDSMPNVPSGSAGPPVGDPSGGAPAPG